MCPASASSARLLDHKPAAPAPGTKASVSIKDSPKYRPVACPSGVAV